MEEDSMQSGNQLVYCLGKQHTWIKNLQRAIIHLTNAAMDDFWK